MKSPKPPQPTLIRMKTARSLAYLEVHGLADFSECKLKAVTNKHRVKAPGGAYKNKSITDGSPTGGV